MPVCHIAHRTGEPLACSKWRSHGLWLALSAVGQAPLPAPWDAPTRACTFRPQPSLKSFFAPKRPAHQAQGEAEREVEQAQAAGGKRPCA